MIMEYHVAFQGPAFARSNIIHYTTPADTSRSSFNRPIFGFRPRLIVTAHRQIDQRPGTDMPLCPYCRSDSNTEIVRNPVLPQR